MREGFLDDVRQWGEKDARIDGIFLVGSYARGTATEESDVDLVILTPRKTELVSDPGFIHRFGKVKKSSVEIWGACTSLRVFYDDMEVEFGIVAPSWIREPLDAGTRRVLEDGYKVILDKQNLFKNMKI